MNDPSRCESLFEKHGFSEYRWIDPKKIIVSQWVRMKCMYGCNEYGRTACCPPNVPSLPECERFFDEYEAAVVFRFEKNVEKPENRFPWTKRVNASLLALERDVFLSGFYKTFLLYMDTCILCRECIPSRYGCKHPKRSRPAPEALGVDVFATVRQVGYPIRVLPDFDETMNRYAFLLIE